MRREHRARTEAWLGRAWARLDASPATHVVAALLVMTLVGPMVLLMAGLSTDASLHERSDVPIFRDRAATILSGGSLYEDANATVVTPPLVNYLLVLPQALGGSLFAYGVFFVLFAWLTASLLYLGLRGRGPAAAAVVAAMVAVHPFPVVTGALMLQDDTIIPLFVVVAMVALLAGRTAQAAWWTGLGVMVKAWPAVQAPAVFFAAKGWRAKGVVAGVGVGAAFLVALPFLVLTPDGFVPFLRFYLLGDAPDGGTFQGLSLWRFLWLQGFTIPQSVNLVALLIASAMLWWAQAKGRVPASNGFTIAYLLFLVLYPKVHLGYYILGLVVVAPWCITARHRAWLLLAAAGLGMLAHLFWMGHLPATGLGGATAIALAAALIAIWAWFIVDVWRSPALETLWEEARTRPPVGVPAMVQVTALSLTFTWVTSLVLVVTF